MNIQVCDNCEKRLSVPYLRAKVMLTNSESLFWAWNPNELGATFCDDVCLAAWTRNNVMVVK